jgi:hypothetical protein
MVAGGGRRTRVEIDGDRWIVNGRPTHAGRSYRDWPIEGLLLNSRMVQAVFDDENPVTRTLWAYPDTGEWDPERNAREFVEAMPAWRKSGLDGFTVNLQGGSPTGYYREAELRKHLSELGMKPADAEIWRDVASPRSQPWINTAFTADGDLKPAYVDRLRRVLDRADQLGFVVVLGLFYQGQDERLRDEKAVTRAVANACDWVLAGGYGNLVIEIDNECDVRAYEHEVLKPPRVRELIELARSRRVNGRRLLVSTSYAGGRVPDPDIVAASDFVLLHGNGVGDPRRIAAMVDEVRSGPGYRPRPILFNEDDHYEFEAPENNFTAALSRRAGWGFFDPGAGAGGHSAFGNYRDGYQNPPVDWGIGTDRKRSFFNLLADVASA